MKVPSTALLGAALGASVGLLLAAPAGAAPPWPDEVDFDALVGGWREERIAELHADPDHVPREVLVEAVRARCHAAGNTSLAAKYFREAWNDAWYGFTEPGAEHDPAVRYRLPFDTRVPRYLSQGVDGPVSHRGRSRYAFDFILPIGAPVMAARDGTVVRVQDGFSERGSQREKAPPGNTLLVLHDDGTFAGYSHLQAGVAVEEGQRVRAGQVIARSGFTGYTTGPHLHFSVMRRVAGAEPETLPIRFGLGSPEGFVPEAGRYYGALPRGRRPLRLRVDGVEVPPDRSARIAWGGSVRLGVEMRLRDGSWRDVTERSFTRIEPLSLHVLQVHEGSRVVARPGPGFEWPGLGIDRSQGGLSIRVGVPGTPGFGVRELWFRVPDAPPS